MTPAPLITTNDLRNSGTVWSEEHGEWQKPALRAEPVRIELTMKSRHVSTLLARVEKFAKIAARHGQKVSAEHTGSKEIPHPMYGMSQPIRREIWTVTIPPMVGVAGRVLAHFERAEDGKSVYVHCFDDSRRADCETFLVRAADCDHCGKKRHRNETYVCEAEGRTLLVGSSCLMDFLGIDPAWALAGCQFMVDMSRDSDIDEENTRGGGGSSFVDTLDLVTQAHRVARKHGGYSREVSDQFHQEVGVLLGFGRGEEAEKIKAAYKGFEPTLDLEAFTAYVSDASGDFGTNLRVALAQDEVNVKRIRLVNAGVGLYVGRAIKKTQEPAKVETRELAADLGQRVDFEATVVRTFLRDSEWGTTCIVNMVTDDGRAAVNFHTGKDRPQAGERYKVRGTVKRHQAAYSAGRETVLGRCSYKPT